MHQPRVVLLGDGAEPQKPKDDIAAPIFILAPPRSFSTVVCAMLGQHPQLYGLPEIHLFGAQTVAEWLQQCADATYPMSHGLLRAVAQLIYTEQTEHTIARARGWLTRRSQLNVGLLYEVLAQQVFPRALVDKSPSIVYSLDFLERTQRLFPNARFIHLVRHPRGQGRSVFKYIEERAKHGPMAQTHWLFHLLSYPFRFPDDDPAAPYVSDPQKGWYVLNRNIVQFLERTPSHQWMRVRGEDVLSQSRTALREIVSWLGLCADDAAIEEMHHPERSPFACYGPVGAKYGNDRLFLDSPSLRPDRAEQLNLEGPMDWSTEGHGFHWQVLELARSFGYT